MSDSELRKVARRMKEQGEKYAPRVAEWLAAQNGEQNHG